MKKRMRTLMSLVLVIMLVASTAVPAMAVASTGTVPMGYYTCNWTVECQTTTGRASIGVSPRSIDVTAYAQNTLYNSLNNITGVSVEVRSVSFANATAIADNLIIDEDCGHRFESEITKTTGRFFVGVEEVVKGANDYPG